MSPRLECAGRAPAVLDRLSQIGPPYRSASAAVDRRVAGARHADVGGAVTGCRSGRPRRPRPAGGRGMPRACCGGPCRGEIFPA